MKSYITGVAIALCAFTVHIAPVAAQQPVMQKATVEIAQMKRGDRTYYMVKMDGKTFGMIELSELERLQDMWDKQRNDR